MITNGTASTTERIAGLVEQVNERGLKIATAWERWVTRTESQEEGS